MTSPAGPVRSRLASCRLYLITPPRPKAGELATFLASVLEAGVDMVQLRDKELEAGALLRFCESARVVTREHGALFIVNDRVDVALACEADGVHLGQDDLPLHKARTQMGRELILGLSTHSKEEIEGAQSSEADYLGVGPVLPTPTKPGRSAVGYELVSYAAEVSGLPFFAIGGMDEDSIPHALEAGATRFSVLRAVTEAEDPASVVRRLRKLIEV